MRHTGAFEGHPEGACEGVMRGHHEGASGVGHHERRERGGVHERGHCERGCREGVMKGLS
uniref:Uncharacterized protein n=1 Tax=Arion vulgaris TaxID=1028688 RepID=A0A0B6YW85_9EUPU